MRWLFSFEGRIGRGAYAAVAFPSFFAGHLAVLLAVSGGQQWPLGNLWFWLSPARWLFSVSARTPEVSMPVVVGLLALMATAAWVASAAAVRRAADMGESGVVAAFAITPLLQIPAILWLAARPAGSSTGDEPAGVDAATATQRSVWTNRLLGLLVATLITLVAVAAGAFAFRSYGYAMFISTPLMVGGIVAFMANRERDIGPGRTMTEVSISLLIAGGTLLAVALEGAVCIVMAAPLAWLMAWIGAAIGRPLARAARPRGRTLVMSIALLPGVFAIDQVIPATAAFEDSRSVVVEAAPDDVWPAVLQMRQIESVPSLPFRLGLAYPLRGEVIGEGIGATRLGHFSTGTATERVTEWTPGRALGFDIISEPATLRELSPYADVHAPHVDGYFRSIHARILLTPLEDGRTRLTLDTTHELDLQPSYYWLPMVRWVVRENKSRVLAQMKSQAEASSRAEPNAAAG